jgi:hypothetical protein
MIQLRSEKNGLRETHTLKEALRLADEDNTIWKISFPLGKERVRLVRGDNEVNWVLDPIEIPDK